ncbi:hypothetical protein EMCRGX_G003376 [Ephydatia muelleri]
MENQPRPQQAVAVVMDNCGRSYSGNTNILTSSVNYPGNWLMCPITFFLLSSIVPLWCVGGDGGYGEEEMMGIGRRRSWYGEEMVWGGDDGYGEEMTDLELVKQQQLMGDELLEINGNSTEGMGHADSRHQDDRESVVDYATQLHKVFKEGYLDENVGSAGLLQMFFSGLRPSIACQVVLKVVLKKYQYMLFIQKDSRAEIEQLRNMMSQQNETFEQQLKGLDTCRQTIDMSGAGRQTIDMSGAGRQTIDMSGAGRQTIDMSGAGRQTIDMSSAGRQTIDMSGAGRQTIDMSSAGRQTIDMSGAGRQTIDMSSAGRQTIDMSSAGRQTIDMSSACWKADL